MKKYEELENKVKELQEEIERLKKKEQNSFIPEGFDLKLVLKILNGTEPLSRLYSAFEFNSTEQGYEYWAAIAECFNQLYDCDIIQLQEWVIRSYQQEFDSK